MMPGADHFRIEYANKQSYEPDFVVKTRSQKPIVETKAANEIRDVLLEFYDFPAEHGKHLRTTNPIESMFATVRHRTIHSKGLPVEQDRTRHGVQARRGCTENLTSSRRPNQLPKIIAKVKFDDGIEEISPQAKAAA